MARTDKVKFSLIIFIIIISILAFLFFRYRPGQIVNGYTQFGKMGFKQLEAPQEGEEVAIIKTSIGDIKIRLFPDAAPMAVENFKSLAKEGFYNGHAFDRVEEDLYIQVRIIDSTKTIEGGYYER